METPEDREQRIRDWLRDFTPTHSSDPRQYAEYWSRPWVSEMLVVTSFGEFPLGDHPA